MTIAKNFINIELGACLRTVSGVLAQTEERLHQLVKSPQTDEDDKKAYSNALVRIQKVRNGLHG